MSCSRPASATPLRSWRDLSAGDPHAQLGRSAPVIPVAYGPPIEPTFARGGGGVSASASASVDTTAAGSERLERRLERLVAAVEAVALRAPTSYRMPTSVRSSRPGRWPDVAWRPGRVGWPRLSRRGSRRASRANPRDSRAGERAADDVRRDLARRLNRSPGETKRAVQDGKRLESVPTAGEAADRGRLSARHQRTADAVVEAMAAALRGGEAPTGCTGRYQHVDVPSAEPGDTVRR